jgi:glycosyltransferase involved in cell wall biosynthesis
MHDYGLVCPKNTFVHRGESCAGPRYGKCVVCAAGQYGATRSVALTTGLTLTRSLRHRVDRYIAVSTEVARTCSSLIADGDLPIAVIPPFLLDENLNAALATRPPFVPATGDYVMYAGALSPHKGIDTLVEAYKGVDPRVPLVVVGLNNAATAYPLPEGLITAQNVSHTEVTRAWKNCTLAVVPSRWPEPFGLVAIEAMAAGRPVIASDIGGLPDIVVDGITGVLVPAGDVAALRANISALLGDPQRRAQMGEAGRQRATRYSASVVVPQIQQIYDEVTSISAS